MILKQINLSGLDYLYDGYKVAADEHRSAYTTKLFSYLEHCMIGLDIDEVTTLELFYLKSFASKIFVVGDYYRNFVNKDNYPELYNLVQDSLNIRNEVLSDSDIDKSKSFIDNMLPIGCKSYHVVAIFKGATITSITSGFPNVLFDGDNGRILDSFPEPYDLENRVSQLFFKNFYSYIAKKSTDIDIVTETMTDMKFYQYADKLVNLAHINTPFGEVRFFKSDAKTFEKQINSIKNNQKTLPIFLSDSIYLTFVLNTTFSTFMKLYLDNDFIVDNQDLKIVSNSKAVLSDDILIKYKNRISTIITSIKEFSKPLNGKDLNFLNYMFSGSLIKYSIQLSATDIDKLMSPDDHSAFSTIDELVSIKTDISNIYQSVISIIQ